ncbi:MAG: DNA topoisomerase (ATP-hydrolyzing) subunit B [bacterium]|nr:DNA topoisomerase (ATP-hydrolyzing) subunit B [bacterium]
MSKEAAKNKEYTAKDIQILEGLEPVRQRPGMYIGSTGPEGLHHLIWEVVDNCLDEAIGGHAKNIEIVLMHNNRTSVEDDGRGIPVDIHQKTKKSALETVLTTLHAGAKFSEKTYQMSGGLHGVGVSVVCALSKYMKAEVCRGGNLYSLEFKQGKAIGKLKKEKTCKKTGTKITFEPDETIFTTNDKFDIKKITNHLRQQAYLTKGIKIRIRDERREPHFTYSFYFEGGVLSYLRYLVRGYETSNPSPFFVQQKKENFELEVAFQYTNEIDAYEESFTNNIFTREGGYHLVGFRTALTRSINSYARKNEFFKEKDENLTGDDVREGLIAVVAIRIPGPQFEGQTKARLGNQEVKPIVEQVVGEAILDYFEKYPQDAKLIIEKCVLASLARKAAKAAKQTVLRKGLLEGLSLPGKLADCINRKSEESEIFIVEGDSAGGSAKSARDRRSQAILPLRGKILNIEKSRIDKVLASQEIRSLVIAMGTAIADDFNIEKLRYHKIIIMTDADVDGAHIRTLLLTLFFRYFKEIIDRGYLYIAQPPLYKVQKGRQSEYAYSEEQKISIMEKFREDSSAKISKKIKPIKKQKDEGEEEEAGEEKISGASIQRYKGLGEMNTEQLWETTMDPYRRVLKKVFIEDGKAADRIFDILMGNEVLPRKKFIQTFAKGVKNLDI